MTVAEKIDVLNLKPVEADLRTAYPEHGQRLCRLYRFVAANPGAGRDQIMHWAGFPDPKANRITAYIEFYNAIIRLNTVLARYGRGVEGGVDTGETYRIAGRAS